ncbi:kinase-like domain-containing protein [Fennellomyces sp. T-0311]|nr:kinase-like domain-containing protein [Fennellomyces sp. T-0311]
MLEGTPVRPQRPGSVSSGSFSHNREPTPSLRNTLTAIEESSPRTPQEVPDRKEEQEQNLNQAKEDHFTPTPEAPRYMHHDEGELSSSLGSPVVYSPIKRPITKDVGPKKVRRAENSSHTDEEQAKPHLPWTILKVNAREYYQISKIQAGGSGVVYKVLSTDTLETFALKEVKLGPMTESSFQACMNEVELLEELQGNDCVVRLLDYEMDEVEFKLKLLFEYGEIDVDKYMQTDQLDIHDTRHFWRKMVEAVRLLHERRIVHSDLKPANFMLVRGRVKIIDFGIAKTISQGTQNIHRDSISGTANYLSPEAVRDVGLVDEDHPDQNTAYPLYKVGMPADIWALGIILYRMTYGTTPFSRFKDIEIKAAAIVRKKIEYPPLTKGNERATAELLSAMKWCLEKDASKRPTAEQLLKHSFLSL